MISGFSDIFLELTSILKLVDIYMVRNSDRTSLLSRTIVMMEYPSEGDHAFRRD